VYSNEIRSRFGVGKAAQAASSSSIGKRRLSGTNTSRSSSFAAWSEMASRTGTAWPSSAIFGATPAVDTVMRRGASANASGWVSTRIAWTTLFKLSSGSPMPMNTTCVRTLPSAASSSCRVQRLVDDLVGAQVAAEAHPAGRAERAVEAAADLRRDAQGLPARLGNDHRFDLRAVTGGQHELARAVRGAVLRLQFERPQAPARRELAASAAGRFAIAAKSRTRRPYSHCATCAARNPGVPALANSARSSSGV
jgi:hypothetical protein